MWNRVVVSFVLLLIGVFIVGCATSESEEKTNLASKPLTTETAKQIGISVSPQVTISEFKAEAESISNDYDTIVATVNTLMDDYGTGKILKQQFLQGMTEAENYLSSLLDKTRELGDKSLDIFYPGEETHLATYLDLAVSEFYQSVKAIREGTETDDAQKIDQGVRWIEEATKDITKFKQGLSQL